ncbi:MAG: helix-turn-helix transcriptional regulator [Myxococcales bacterium]|nr:helix-turn-helix domain-containing protein [Deltaproteobacteria bacterium]NND30747.1 helix-turn-helix transcriptional regulator [Myxococcales bacterium]NNL26649.1 helix-turn-helix transcriptional regulator [Myxococcales bacterium]
MATRKRKKRRRPAPSDGRVDAMELLESLHGPMTLGDMLWSLRVCDEISQAEFARRLDVSRSHLCDVEKGRKLVSAERAAAWAKVLGFPETVFVKLALQEQLDRAGVKMNVQVEAA